MTIEEAAKTLKSKMFFYPDIRKVEAIDGKLELTCDTERVFELFKSVHRIFDNTWEGYELVCNVVPVEEEVTFGRPFEEPEQPFEKTLRVEAALREQEEEAAKDKVTSQMISDTLDNPSEANIKKLSKHLGEKVIHDEGKLIVTGKGGARVIMKNPIAKELNEAMSKMSGTVPPPVDDEDEDEDKTYMPEEIIFHVMPGNADFDTDTVVFTTKKCWEENGYQSDDLGGHNMPGQLLESCGVCSCEMMESVFELESGFTPDKVKENLLAAGFIENADFSKYIEEETR